MVFATLTEKTFNQCITYDGVIDDWGGEGKYISSSVIIRRYSHELVLATRQAVLYKIGFYLFLSLIHPISFTSR